MPEPFDIQVPATELEIAEAIVDNAPYHAETIRKLAFERDRLIAEVADTHNEIKSVLQMLDELAELWGDEGKFRRCRDRLRKLVEL